MDMLALTNCMVNFILYCIMSRQFRLTFKKIFGIQKTVLCLRKSCPGNAESPIDDLLVETYLMVSRDVGLVVILGVMITVDQLIADH